MSLGLQSDGWCRPETCLEANDVIQAALEHFGHQAPQALCLILVRGICKGIRRAHGRMEDSRQDEDLSSANAPLTAHGEFRQNKEEDASKKARVITGEHADLQKEQNEQVLPQRPMGDVIAPLCTHSLSRHCRHLSVMGVMWKQISQTHNRRSALSPISNPRCKGNVFDSDRV